MSVTYKKNRDMNGFSKQKIPNLAVAGEEHTSRPPSATTRNRLGFCRRPLPMLVFLRGNGLHDTNEAESLADYCTSYQHTYTRTVSHYAV